MKFNFNTKYFAKNFIWLDCVESTNTFIKENESILKDKTVVATNNQTKGRGTKKRQFKSVPFKTLAISIFFKNIEVDLIQQIPITLAVSMIKTLNDFSIFNCKIKWFNDILIDNKKIAGILCESKILKNTANLVAGIGINLNSTKEELKKLDLNEAASIFSETNLQIKTTIFTQTLIENLEKIYIKYLLNKKLKELNHLFCQHCCTLNKHIKVFNLKTNDIFYAKAILILQDGTLLVETKKEKLVIDYSSYSITQFNY